MPGIPFRLRMIITSFLMLYAVSLHAQSMVYTRDTVPNPRVQYGGFVADPDEVLGQQGWTLNLKLVEFERRTSNEIAVVVLPSIGTSNIEQFSTQLFNKWGIGKRDKNNGLLLLLVMDQRKWRFTTGYGLEHICTKPFLERVGQEEMLPHLKQGNTSQAVSVAVDEVIRKLNGEDSSYRPREATTKMDWRPTPVQFLPLNLGHWNTPIIMNPETQKGWYIAGGILTFFYLFVAGFYAAITYSGNKKREHGKYRSTFFTLVHYLYLPALFWLSVISGFTPSVVILGYLVINILMGLDRSRRNAKIARYYPDLYRQYSAIKKDHGPGFYFKLIVFPFAMIPFLVIFILKRIYLRRTPRACPKCQTLMTKLDERADDAFLTEGKQMEEYVKSIDYDVWSCPACQHVKIEPYEAAFTSFSACPDCSHKTYHTISDRTIDSPSCYDTGEGERQYKCEHCHLEKTVRYVIPRRNCESRSSSISFSSSGSSSSSSFGGGSSGGSGSGGSW